MLRHNYKFCCHTLADIRIRKRLFQIGKSLYSCLIFHWHDSFHTLKNESYTFGALTELSLVCRLTHRTHSLAIFIYSFTLSCRLSVNSCVCTSFSWIFSFTLHLLLPGVSWETLLKWYYLYWCYWAYCDLKWRSYGHLALPFIPIYHLSRAWLPLFKYTSLSEKQDSHSYFKPSIRKETVWNSYSLRYVHLSFMSDCDCMCLFQIYPWHFKYVY